MVMELVDLVIDGRTDPKYTVREYYRYCLVDIVMQNSVKRVTCS